MEQDSNALMKVTAFDENGEPFDVDEYRHMDLQLDFKSHRNNQDGLVSQRIST